VPFQIPTILVISERGTLGEFNIGQVAVAKGVGLANSQWVRDDKHFD